ncbi:prostaglandin E2 receptor EP3 subtype [Ammospiza nelsoni]|uniref:prostaglandin E2 receptor EP3 subtype n=1 Tax=Ammospiza caudacuta TaxID=2857398 RepID=UPI0027385FA0|nr:prostaglandin E2 receptor EP3 subtype [Ammospiza caudacuta]XP_059334671.1 prostaglandin E2 receptor EP3 subtype [Ammospiza nelsoni]
MSPWQQRPPNGSAAGGPGPRGNGTGRAERGSAVSVAIPLTMMLTGVAGNALAMLLVSRSYRAKGSRRKRSFLLCIGSLALTDMLGQLLTSPVVISVYLSGRPWAAMDPSGRLCDFFGFSMTVFGLCPLLIASAMAVERALAIRAPHWYASHMSPRATERGLAAIWAAGVAFALLPLAGLGRYALQWPGTWCFISTAGGSAFAAAFAALGLLSLVVTGACNLATIEALVSRCRAKAGAPQPGSRWGRIATETLLQLLGIMCVLSACWAPLLVTMLQMVSEPPAGPCQGWQRWEPRRECNLPLTAVRLASLNQILDPWVYLLLRRILLRKCRQAASAVSHCPNGAECRDSHTDRALTLSRDIRRTAA